MLFKIIPYESFGSSFHLQHQREAGDESGVQWTNLIRSKVIGHGETRQGYKMISSSKKLVYEQVVSYCESQGPAKLELTRSVPRVSCPSHRCDVYRNKSETRRANILDNKKKTLIQFLSWLKQRKRKIHKATKGTNPSLVYLHMNIVRIYFTSAEQVINNFPTDFHFHKL